MRQAAETYEERKVPLLARLYSAVAHDATVSPELAIYLVRIAGDLTYRQFVALGLYANYEEHKEALWATSRPRPDDE